MTPRVPLSAATFGAGLGAALAFMLGGAGSAPLGAIAGLAFTAIPNRRKRAAQTKTAHVSDEQARERRTLFVRALASSKVESVEKVARGFRQAGALVAARALAQHAADLRAVAEKKVDEKLIASFEEKLALVRESYGDDSKEVQSARANVDAAHAAMKGETPT